LQSYGVGKHTDDAASIKATHTALIAAVQDQSVIEGICKKLSKSKNDNEVLDCTGAPRFWAR
jgi:hypothetical protein